MRAAFISAECEPFAKTGGLGDVVDALARAVPKSSGAGDGAGGQELGVEPEGSRAVGPSDRDARVEAPVDVFLPRYRSMPVPADALRIPLRVPDPAAADGLSDVSLVEFEARGYRVRLVDHPPAFDRAGYYGDDEGDYPDNAWRFGLLCRTALEAIRQDERPIDVLHLHDWQAMPAVLYRDVAYADEPRVAAAAAVVTIHNLAYQGWISRAHLAGFAFPAEIARLVPRTADGLLLLREGVRRAELVNTVSPGYAREVLTPAFGMDMQDVLRSLGDRFGGIINGLDMAVWDPATDAELPARYRREDLSGKAACRSGLLREIGFDADDPGPLLGMIGRLDPQKGFDLLTAAAEDLLAAGARIVALGTGDKKLVAELARFAARHPDRVAVVERFDRGLARRIYGGADLYVMPSRFEPCGQGQMIALRYGTPPIVRSTGGLADTVVDADERPAEGTGFVFDQATPEALFAACERAMAWHGRPAEWRRLQDRGMAIDWSWEGGPGPAYAAWYRRAEELRRGRRVTSAS